MTYQPDSLTLAPQLLSPPDWTALGADPEFIVRTTDASSVRVRIYRLSEWRETMLESPVVAEVRPKPVLEDLAAATPNVRLKIDDYIAVLDWASESAPVSISGFLVRSQADVWTSHFRQMIATAASRSNPPQGLFWRPRSPLFSITTTVYDTPVLFLTRLAEYVRNQRWRHFEWLLLDNGSTSEATVQACRGIASASRRVKYHRVERNLHIIGGNRHLLERATGRYIVPVDSDDVLYPHSLDVIARAAFSNGMPDLLYTDEQKVSVLDTPVELIWRPKWSPLFNISTCPASHLMAFDRKLALSREVYSEDYARGSHDWDTALRFTEAGARALHVPQVAYGWRMHPASSAQNEDSKAYLGESQSMVVEQSLARRGLSNRFEVHPAHDMLGYYHATRKHMAAPPVAVHIVAREESGAAARRLIANVEMVRYPNARIYVWFPRAASRSSAALVQSTSQGAVVRTYSSVTEVFAQAPSLAGDAAVTIFLNSSFQILNPEWIWDIVGTFELDTETGIVGGVIVDLAGRIQSIGYVAGLDGFIASPGYGLPVTSVRGALPQLCRHVTAIHGGMIAIRRETLHRAGVPDGMDHEDAVFGIEYCLRAARLGIRTAYTPHFSSSSEVPLFSLPGQDTRMRALIESRYAPSMDNDPYYSPHCSRVSGEYGDPAPFQTP